MCLNTFKIRHFLLTLILSVFVFWITLANAQTTKRLIPTAYGMIAVPETPHRVLTLYEAALDTSLAVGIKPIGAIATRNGTQVANYIAPLAQNITIVGGPRVINFEAVLQAQPDLILASPFLSQQDYERLRLIAPTIVPIQNHHSPFAKQYWRKESELFARALNKSEELDQIWFRLDQQIAALRSKINPHNNASIALLRWNPQGPLVMSAHIFAGQLLAQLGFKQPVIAEALIKRPHSDPLSLENLALLDEDWLILATLTQNASDALKQAKQQPIFAQLSVVKQHHVLTVDGQLWSSAAGPLAAKAIVADLNQKMMSSLPAATTTATTTIN